MSSKDAFLAVLSHEIKTPVTALKLKIQLARRIVSGDVASSAQLKQLHKLLTEAELDVDRIVGFIDALTREKRGMKSPDRRLSD